MRRLAAVMFTDTVGFTASAHADEGRTLELMQQQAELIRPLLTIHQGREIKSTGDGFLVEFDSALKATQCAIGIQRRVYERAAEGAGVPFQIRIGIHLGDVVERDGDILGDAVNIAARIEPRAEPGGICVSGAVREQIQNKVPDRLERLPPAGLKGVAEPVEVYRIVLPWTGSGVPQTDPAGPAARARLAVLPFVNISPDPNDEFFADGLTEELIASLALVRGLKVIARTSVMSYKHQPKKVSEIGRELGVGTIVEGSVRRAANRIRVTIQVIDVATEEHLWASNYDDNLDDVFAVQREIASRVVASIPGNLRPASVPLPELDKARETESYLAYLQGQALMWRREEAPLREAIRFFEQAIARDPTFARAHAGIARTYVGLGLEGFVPWSESIAKGRAAAQTAADINPELAEAHALLAEIAFMSDDPDEVVDREARRAIQLNPNLAEAHDLLGQVAGALGNIELYVSQAEMAYQLDPLSIPTIAYLGRAYFFAGRLEEAFAHWQRTVHLDPLNAYRGMADLWMLKGDLVRAEACVRELERVGPKSDFALLCRGYLAALRGDRATAMVAIRKLQETFGEGYARLSSVGFIYLALGDLDRFFEQMFVAARSHTLQISRLRFSPLFREARKDPRFLELLTLDKFHPPPSPNPSP